MDVKQWLVYTFALLSLEGQMFSWVGSKRGCEAYSYIDEAKLLKNLTSRCRKSIRPVFNSSDAVTVELDITFNHVIDVDETKQQFKSSVWIRQKWKNEVLSWDPSEYGGVTSVVVPAQDVWLPDLVLHNNVFEEFDGRLDNIVTRITMTSSGNTTWAAPFVFLTSCKIDVSDFPFDKQKCNLKFSSWVYPGTKINLTGMGNQHALLAEKKVDNGEWEVISIPIKRNVRYYESLPGQPYPDMNFIIHLKRRSLFYIINLVIPNFLITLLAFFSFFIPVECGERISFIVTVLLSMTVFLLLVAQSIPPTSDAVPVISIYFTASIVEVSLALIATGVSLRINYSYLFGKKRMSPQLKRFLFGTLGPKLGLDTSSFIKFEGKREEVKQKSNGFYDFRKMFRKRRKSSLVIEKVHQLNPISPAETTIANGGRRNHKPLSSVFSSSSDENSDSFCSCTAVYSHERRSDSCPAVYSQERTSESCPAAQSVNREHRESEMSAIAEGVNFVARTLQDDSRATKESLECKLAAAVVDRAFMFLFVILFIVSSITILLLPLMRT